MPHPTAPLNRKKGTNRTSSAPKGSGRKSSGKKPSSRKSPTNRQTQWAIVLLTLIVIAIFTSMYLIDNQPNKSSKKDTKTAISSSKKRENTPSADSEKQQDEASKGNTEKNQHTDSQLDKQKLPSTKSTQKEQIQDQSPDSQSNTRNKTVQTKALELPLIYDSTYIIKNKKGRYTLMYNILHKQAEWVAYLLTRADVRTKGAERSDDFTPDPFVAQKGWATARNSDYTRSGYDRGHLLPSADRDDTQAENQTTFFFSNMSPQKPNLNRKTWNKLETQTRQWADRYDSLYIVTGPIFSAHPQTIGRNKVSVPKYFYKVLLVKQSEQWQAIGFILPNSDEVKSDFKPYLQNIDSVEAITGLNFFEKLPDSLENRIERECNPKFWGL